MQLSTLRPCHVNPYPSLQAASGAVATLVRELRAVVPHVFCNMYLTPPHARAVDAHADDRDVVVIQLKGRKRWRVQLKDPPVPFPVTDEQVGKGGREVPDGTLRAADPSCTLTATLEEGDVLYIPRGFVHEAATGDDAPSLHLTLAVPTHDWSWAATASRVLEQLKQAPPAGDYAPGDHKGFAASLRARDDCGPGRDRWLWRRSVPPALMCPASFAHVPAAS